MRARAVAAARSSARHAPGRRRLHHGAADGWAEPRRIANRDQLLEETVECSNLPPIAQDDLSSNRHPALICCLSMISGQTLRVCPEGKPVSTFPDHALAVASVDLEALARNALAFVGSQKKRQTRDVVGRHRIGNSLTRAKIQRSSARPHRRRRPLPAEPAYVARALMGFSACPYRGMHLRCVRVSFNMLTRTGLPPHQKLITVRRP